MQTIIPNILIDDVPLHKNLAAKKMGRVLSMVHSYNQGTMIRTASRDSNRLITLFTEMLSNLKMSAKEENVKEILNKITAESEGLNKNASMNKNSMERRDDIKIV